MEPTSALCKRIRKELGLSQKEMAELLGYAGQKDVSRLEAGRENNQVRAHLRTIEDNLEAVRDNI